jgi:hypothetical protein
VFTILPVTVTLTSPNGSERWISGKTYAITWTHQNVTNVKIEYSTDNGSSWNQIVASTAVGEGTYAWTVPNAPAAQCLVRVSDASNAAVNDQSNAVFTIINGLLPPSNLTVSDVPNDQGHSLRLSWTASLSEKDGLVTGYRIFRSRSSALTAPIPLTLITSLDSLLFYEERCTILIDSVAVGVTTFTDSSVPLNRTPYYYWVQTVGAEGASKPVISTTATAVEESAQSPRDFRLGEARPNPFNPSTTIEYTLPGNAHITLQVYNISGQKVATLVESAVSAGKHSSVWDARGMPSGVYFYTLRTEGYCETKRVLLLK